MTLQNGKYGHSRKSTNASDPTDYQQPLPEPGPSTAQMQSCHLQRGATYNPDTPDAGGELDGVWHDGRREQAVHELQRRLKVLRALIAAEGPPEGALAYLHLHPLARQNVVQ